MIHQRIKGRITWIFTRKKTEKVLSSNESKARICPYCGQSYKTVFVHGHEQCVLCNMNIEPCCESEVLLEKCGSESCCR